MKETEKGCSFQRQPFLNILSDTLVEPNPQFMLAVMVFLLSGDITPFSAIAPINSAIATNATFHTEPGDFSFII